MKKKCTWKRRNKSIIKPRETIWLYPQRFVVNLPPQSLSSVMFWHVVSHPSLLLEFPRLLLVCIFSSLWKQLRLVCQTEKAYFTIRCYLFFLFFFLNQAQKARKQRCLCWVGVFLFVFFSVGGPDSVICSLSQRAQSDVYCCCYGRSPRMKFDHPRRIRLKKQISS